MAKVKDKVKKNWKRLQEDVLTNPASPTIQNWYSCSDDKDNLPFARDRVNDELYLSLNALPQTASSSEHNIRTCYNEDNARYEVHEDDFSQYCSEVDIRVRMFPDVDARSDYVRIHFVADGDWVGVDAV